MKISTLVTALKLMPSEISIMLKGETGIGKSQVVAQLADHFKLELLDMRISQMTEGDILGLPSVDGNVTRFNPPWWFKKACDKPCMLFLDETNRGTPEVIAAAFQIVLDRKLGENKLHPQTRVYGAVNEGAIYQVNEMDPAFFNRFASFEVEPSVEEWLDWAKGAGLHEFTRAFIAENHKMLERQKSEPYKPGKVYPTRRSWTNADKSITHAQLWDSGANPTFRAICSSMIGEEAASAFVSWIKTNANDVTVKDVLDNFPKVEKSVQKLSNEKIQTLIDKLNDHWKSNELTQDQAKNIGRFMRNIKGELIMSAWTKLTESNNLANVKACHKYCIGYVMAAIGKPFPKDQWVGPDGDSADNVIPAKTLTPEAEEPAKAKKK